MMLVACKPRAADARAAAVGAGGMGHLGREDRSRDGNHCAPARPGRRLSLSLDNHIEKVI
jgi:hypothetical protein